jgi:DNA-binding response OmpR family regulator
MSGDLFHIVLVEDAEPDVFLVREALQQSGLKFELHVLDDGEKAVEFITRLDLGLDEGGFQPDLFLLDLNLPRENGSQVLARMRRSVSCARVPVLIVTSSDSPSDKAQAMRLGATQYFRKPSQLDEFLKLGPLVRSLLEGRDRDVRAQGTA